MSATCGSRPKIFSAGLGDREMIEISLLFDGLYQLLMKWSGDSNGKGRFLIRRWQKRQLAAATSSQATTCGDIFSASGSSRSESATGETPSSQAVAADLKRQQTKHFLLKRRRRRRRISTATARENGGNAVKPWYTCINCAP